MRKAAILAALFAAAICQTSPAEEAQEQLDRAQRQLAGLRKQLGQRAAALNDLAARGAPYEVLYFHEAKRSELQKKIEMCETGVQGWEARKRGEEELAAEKLARYDALRQEEQRKTGIRAYCQHRGRAETDTNPDRRKGALRAAQQMEQRWDERSREQAQALATAYLAMQAAQRELDAVQMAQLMVRRRVLEDRANVLDRVRYHLEGSKGKYLENPDFEEQYRKLWSGLLGEFPDAAAKELIALIRSARQTLHLTHEQLSEARRLYMVSYFGSDLATSGMEMERIVSVRSAAESGTRILTEARKALEALEAGLEPALKRLGYDSSLELRRPIEFDKRGNPSDVIFILDGRAGPFLKVLEADATGTRYRSPLPFGEDGKIALEPATDGEPDVSQGELYQTCLVNLYNHHNNVGLPKSFWQTATEDMLAQNAAGDRSKQTVNIWHPKVREFTERYFQALGQFLGREPGFLLYDHVTWEPSFAVPPKKRESRFFGYAIQPGRSETGKQAFKDWLKDKFKGIDKLNTAWGSGFANFGEIEPPSDPFTERRRRATPLTYEHERFLRESLADYVGLACGSIMKGDSRHPVIYEMPGMMDHAMECCFANVPLLERVPAQMVEMHKNDFWPALPVQVYAATVIPMYGKIPVHTEFIWNWGRRSTPSDDAETYAQGLQSIWRNAAHGIRVLFPFAHYDWPGYGNGYADWFVAKDWTPGWRSRTGAILREATASLAVGARRARRFGELLRGTELAPREVGVIQPSTSTTNAYPYYSISWSFNAHVIESKIFHDLLFNRNVQYGYVPEEAFGDGHARMKDYPVLVLPYAPYLPDGVSDKLLQYVKQGGTLICSGVPGLYDKYGRDDGSLVREVFGAIDVTYSGNDYIWQYDLVPRSLKEGRDVLVEAGEKALLVSARYGPGTVLISAIPYGQRPGSAALVPHFLKAVNDALGTQLVRCAYDRFEVVARTKGRRLFLFVSNYSLTNVLEDHLTVKGEYRRLVDHGIGPKFEFRPLGKEMSESLRMPVDHGVFYYDAHSPKGLTSFWLRLHPGEGTVIELVK